METFVTASRGFTVALAMLAAIAIADVAGQATPEASPQASPVAVAGDCDGLPTYFQQLAGLTLENDGLVTLREAGYNVPALTDEEAAAVVTSLDTLVVELEAMAPLVPAPAVAYHDAYLQMMAWYRALTADRDTASYQRLINDDRRLFGLMGLAVQSGQAACGYDAWNEARDAAFNSEE